MNEALSAGSLDASSTIVPLAMERVALGEYIAREFDGPMQECMKAKLVVFSGIKIDKLDDLEAMIDRGTIRTVSQCRLAGDGTEKGRRARWPARTFAWA